nr:zinc finger, CCHC-type [Tanacetum cinerariifolium]
MGPAPPDPETADLVTIVKYYESVNLEQEVACLMLSSMSLDLQRTLEKYNAYDIIGKTIAELHAMLKLHEKGIPKKAKTLAVLATREGKIQKEMKKPQGAKGKNEVKTKLAYATKPKIPPTPKRDNLAKDSICHRCKEENPTKGRSASQLPPRSMTQALSMSSKTLANLLGYSTSYPHLGVQNISRIDCHAHNMHSSWFDSFFPTQRIRHHVRFTQMVTNFAVIVAKKLNPSSLAHIQLLLIKDVLETSMVSVDDTLRPIQVMSLDFKSENYCA